MYKLLVIQTSFTGDVVLATSVAEKLHHYFPDAQIDFLVRKGNEGLLTGHPFIQKTWVWDKKNNKNKNLWNLIFEVRRERYTHVINLQRFVSSGLITCLSGAKYKAGFDKNPLSFCFSKRERHTISTSGDQNPVHEINRNQSLIADLTDNVAELPKLYPSKGDYIVANEQIAYSYICIAPSSVWFTKQFPVLKWVELVELLPLEFSIFIIGAANDGAIAEEIIERSGRKNIKNLCGKYSYLQSVALMEGAVMNYVNDSAPLHFASATCAPVTAVFCSTVPAFGFGPLCKNSKVVEISVPLKCRPCGLHGRKACPEKHFRCAMDIKNEQLLWWTTDKTLGTV